jgi:hypothetical protein
MPQMELKRAQDLILQVVENPDGPATQQISTRDIAQALATVLVRSIPFTRPADD